MHALSLFKARQITRTSYMAFSGNTILISSNCIKSCLHTRVSFTCLSLTLLLQLPLPLSLSISLATSSLPLFACLRMCYVKINYEEAH